MWERVKTFLCLTQLTFNPFPLIDTFRSLCSRWTFVNIVEKRETAHNEQFQLHSTTCLSFIYFSKSSATIFVVCGKGITTYSTHLLDLMLFNYLSIKYMKSWMTLFAFPFVAKSDHLNPFSHTINLQQTNLKSWKDCGKMGHWDFCHYVFKKPSAAESIYIRKRVNLAFRSTKVG